MTRRRDFPLFGSWVGVTTTPVLDLGTYQHGGAAAYSKYLGIYYQILGIATRSFGIQFP